MKPTTKKLAATGTLLLFLAPVTAAGAAEHQITIAMMKFAPADVQLKSGDVVVWRNNDIFRHTATARGGGFDVDLPPRAERRVTITESGPVEYFCRFHPAMVGKLEVQP